MTRRILINGWFLTQYTTGVQRVAREILGSVDSISASEHIYLLVPRGYKEGIGLSNIRVVECGLRIPIVWEQIVFPFYAALRKMIPFSFCNVVPFFYPGVVFIHDVFYKTMPHVFCRNVRGFLAMVWHRLHYRWAAMFARVIFTNSEWSKMEILSNYNVKEGRVKVIPLGWEHMQRIALDDAVFMRFPHIIRGTYYFVLGSLNAYKNLRWVFSAALQHPECSFVITGKPMSSAMPTGAIEEHTKNMVFTGYLSDSEMKSLMTGCKALLHPSMSEGFGLPPLEALALGRPVIVARRTALPEIYGNAAHYIEDPSAYSNVDPDSILKTVVANPDVVLSKYTWKNAAAVILETCVNLK